jgi:ParB/RepB/Spo0J family partition protein
MIRTADAIESKTNPRGKKFEGQEFDELVASIREQGVIVPVLARPLDGGKYEIVAGNRRLRASLKAGLLEIPANVQSLTDVQAREMQIVENLQRADIHPLEEGEAYRKLIEESQYDIEAVAKKVGKSVTYVRDRLALTNLIKSGKEAFRDGRMNAGHASLIARLDDKLQKEAVAEVAGEPEDRWHETPTTSELRDWIQARIYRDSMDTPPWKGDAEAQAVFEGCEECKGKGGTLFGKDAAEACTNPKCYAQRMAAYIALETGKHPELVRLTGGYSNDGDLIGRSSYHEITGKKDGCEHEEKGIVISGDGIGHKKAFCRAPECKKHWAKETPGGHYKPTPEELAARKKVREAEAAKKEKANAALAAALQRITWPLSENALDVLIDLVFSRFGYSYLQPVAARHGIKAEKKERNGYTSRDLDTPLRKWVDAQGKEGKLRFVFEVALEMTDTAKFIKKL